MKIAATQAPSERLDQPQPDSAVPPVSWRQLFFPLLALLLLAGAWTIASPVGGAADEPAHAINAAAVVRGQFIVPTRPAHNPGEFNTHIVTVPSYVAELASGVSCFAFREEVPATCLPGVDASHTDLVEADNAAANYPPLYYLLVGWLTLVTRGVPALYGMRVMSALMAWALFAVGLKSVVDAWATRRVVPLAIAVLSPVVFFFSSAINPQSLEISASFALTGLLAPLAITTRHLSSRLVGGGLMVALLVLSRPSGLVWAAVIVAAVACTIPWSRYPVILRCRGMWTGAVVAAAACVVAVSWHLVAQPGKSLRSGASKDITTLGGLIRLTDLELLGYWGQLVTGTGWLDVPGVGVAVALFTLLVGGLIVKGCLSAPPRTVLAVLALLVLTPATAVIISWPTLRTVGTIWQGRYLLPLVVATALICVVALRGDAQMRSNRAMVAYGLGFILIQGSVLVRTMRRFRLGVSARGTGRSVWGVLNQWGWVSIVLFTGFAVLLGATLALDRRQGHSPGADRPSI